jgi:hypothetical protein
VFGKDDQQTTDEDDDEKHPSIIKNGVMETDLNVSRIRFIPDPVQTFLILSPLFRNITNNKQDAKVFPKGRI